jgi:hypothetical protein
VYFAILTNGGRKTSRCLSIGVFVSPLLGENEKMQISDSQNCVASPAHASIRLTLLATVSSHNATFRTQPIP